MSEIIPSLTLQEKVSQRIKEQIGELIDTADLEKLVDQAMQEAFFKGRVIKSDGYGRKEMEPPLLVVTVKELLADQMKAQIETWLAEHKDEVKKVLDDVIKEGLINTVIASFNNKVQGDLYSFGNSLAQRLTGRPL